MFVMSVFIGIHRSCVYDDGLDQLLLRRHMLVLLAVQTSVKLDSAPLIRITFEFPFAASSKAEKRGFQ